MNTATLDTPVADQAATVRDRVLDATRHVAHISHEAKLLKSIATDAVEDGLHAARRAVKNATRGAADFKDDAVYGIKRQPLKSIAIAAAIGLAVGTIVGWCGARAGGASQARKPVTGA